MNRGDIVKLSDGMFHKKTYGTQTFANSMLFYGTKTVKEVTDKGITLEGMKLPITGHYFVYSSEMLVRC